MRTQYIGFMEQNSRTIAQHLESTADVVDDIFVNDIMPSVRGIEAVWGSYGD
jgi:hypothetical protein